MAKHNTDMIYGLHAVESALKNNPGNILQVWIQSGKKDRRIQSVLNLAKQSGLSVEQISTDKIKQKCPGARHQGVIAKIRIDAQAPVQLEDILERDRLLLLVLDGVQDPHNIGACLRSADAAGVDAVISSKNRSPGLTAVVRKVASGAAESVPYIQVSNLARALQTMKDNNIWVIGTTDGADDTIYDCEPGARMALVMGAEDKGLRRLTAEHCDQLVRIPMRGSVTSLNVSVATGICLFELTRKNNNKIIHGHP